MRRPPARVLGQLIHDRAQEKGSQPFVRFRGEWYSYRQVDALSGQVAAGLRALGVTKGDCVAIMLPNLPEFLALWLGANKLGAVEVPVNTDHIGELLVYLLNHCEAKVLCVAANLLPRISAVQERLSALRKLVVLPVGSESSPMPPLGDLEVIPFADLLTHGMVEPDPTVRPEDPFSISYTSGTTGPSKGVLLPHNYAIHLAEMIAHLLDYTADDTLYSFLPLFHGNAQMLAFLAALVGDARFALGERFSASRFWDEVRESGATATNVVGGVIGILMKQPVSAGDRDHSLRRMFTAAAPTEIWRAFEDRFGVTLLEGYGMTECGMILMNRLDDSRLGSVGKVAPGYQVLVVDDQDNPLHPGQVGEIVSRPTAPWSMMLGYYRMPEKTLESYRNLWFHTGDLGKYDEDGYFYFVDRKKDAIRRMGENISSQELERIVSAHPAVLECAAFGVPSELSEEDVMVAVVLHPGRSLTPPELAEYCAANMARFMVPRYIEVMESLPKTPTQRIEKYKLKSRGRTPATWDRLAAEPRKGGT